MLLYDVNSGNSVTHSHARAYYGRNGHSEGDMRAARAKKAARKPRAASGVKADNKAREACVAGEERADSKAREPKAARGARADSKAREACAAGDAMADSKAREPSAAGEERAESKAREACAAGGDMLRMDRLPIGVPARVAELEASGGLRRRLIELGFFEGERVEKVLKSPLGDPSAYLVRGTVTAIRDADAAKVLVQAEGAVRAAEPANANGGGAGRSIESNNANGGAARSAEYSKVCGCGAERWGENEL